MAFDKLKTYRDRFYKYINKADLLIAITTILSSVATTTISSMYSYLDDKEYYTLKKLNNEINHINIEFIDENEYFRRIDEDNWLSSKERDEKLAQQQKEQEELQKRKNEDNLPQMAKKKNIVQNTKYFVVRDEDGLYRDVYKYRRDNKSSTTKEQKEEICKYAGRIGHEDIRKESVGKSIIRIFKGLFGYKEVKKHIVINSRYDQYGRRIDKEGGIVSGNKNANNVKNKKRKVSKKTLKQQRAEEIAELQRQIAEKERKIVELREKQEDAMIKVRQFTLDGSLQAMDSHNALLEATKAGNKSSKIIRMMAMLEYKYEQCWYKKSKYYSKVPISVDYVVDYDKDFNPIKIRLVKVNGSVSRYKDYIDKMKNEAKYLLQTCDISKVDGLKKSNYKYWKQVKLTFQGAN